MYYIKIICAFILFQFLTSEFVHGQKSAQEIFEKAKDQVLSKNFEMGMDITTTDKKGRVKEKTIRVLMAKIDDIDKTKVSWMKPERAKGTTVVITGSDEDKGIIEVYTPSNGKTRKMKASSANMKMIGSEFSMSNFNSEDSESLNYALLKEEVINNRTCYLIKVTSETAKAESRGQLWIEKSSFKIIQIKVFNAGGKNTRLVKLDNYQSVNETENKIQAMHIINEDYENKKTTEMHVTEILSRNNLTSKDFLLPVEAKD